ncbi:hypothetical protein AB4501_23025, partial [Vibrio sp. 10N.222.55.E8]
RFSAVQKEILTILAKAFIGGVKEAKSTDVNALVNMNLKKDIHPNNGSFQFPVGQIPNIL